MTLHHLSPEDRYKIPVLLKEAPHQTQTALNFGADMSIVSREIVRDRNGLGYRPQHIDNTGRAVDADHLRRRIRVFLEQF